MPKLGQEVWLLFAANCTMLLVCCVLDERLAMEEEKPALVEHAMLAAKEAAAASAASVKEWPPALSSIPACVHTSPSFLSNAFFWAVQYTNALRSLLLSSTEDLLGHVTLRLAGPEDCCAIDGLVRELAVYEKEPLESVKSTPESLQRDGGFAWLRGERSLTAPLFHVVLATVPLHIAHQWEEKGAEASGTGAAAAGSSSSSSSSASPAGSSVFTVSGSEGAGVAPASYSIVGMAFCHSSYSTWEGRCVYLEDLYIRPAFRRQGVSTLLLQTAARAACVAKCARMQWSVLDWNEAAIASYVRPEVGASLLEEWKLYRVYAEQLRRMAGF